MSDNNKEYTFENISKHNFETMVQLREAVFACGKVAGSSLYTRSSNEKEGKIL